MQSVTFYTDKDIHQQVMECFDHKAELINETICLMPVNNRLRECELTNICKQLTAYAQIKDVKVFYSRNKPLIVLTYRLIKNTVKCISDTRNKDILQLHDMLKEIYNNSSIITSLVLKHETTVIIDGCSLEVYRDSTKKEPINILRDLTRPLLLQLDSFMAEPLYLSLDN